MVEAALEVLLRVLVRAMCRTMEAVWMLFSVGGGCELWEGVGGAVGPGGLSAITIPTLLRTRIQTECEDSANSNNRTKRDSKAKM